MANRQTIHMPTPECVKHERLRDWVRDIATLTQPDRIHWADGSQPEYECPHCLSKNVTDKGRCLT
jgi:GTP-dependent phosphoenolpyruvate carboxykinase